MLRQGTGAFGLAAILSVAACAAGPAPVAPVEAPAIPTFHLQASMVEAALRLNQPMIRISGLVLRLVNKERTSRGIPALVPHKQLITAAGRHSRDMALNDYAAHTNLQGQGIGDRIRAAGYTTWTAVAENIFPLNPPDDTVAKRAIDGWMKSDGHRANILNPKYTRTGLFGYRRASDGKWYFTQVFAD